MVIKANRIPLMLISATRNAYIKYKRPAFVGHHKLTFAMQTIIVKLTALRVNFWHKITPNCFPR